jgi:hypothetical protein
MCTDIPHKIHHVLAQPIAPDGGLSHCVITALIMASIASKDSYESSMHVSSCSTCTLSAMLPTASLKAALLDSGHNVVTDNLKAK